MLVFGVEYHKGSGFEINIEKKSKYLYLRKPFDEQKEFRMDLSNGEFERINFYKKGTKITPVKVENITNWFTHCSLFCDDEKFGKVILYNKYLCDNKSYKSPVRFIQTLTHRKPRNYEAWLSLGIRIHDIEDRIERAKKQSWGYNYNYHNVYIAHSPQDFSKEALKYIRQFNSLSSAVIDTIYEMDKRVPDLGLITYLLNKTNENPQYREFFTVEDSVFRPATQDYENRQYNVFDLTKHNNHRKTDLLENIIGCITSFNLDIDAFLKFCLRAYHVEGLDIKDLFNTRHYSDYLQIEKQLKHNQMRKMDKYPKNFLTKFHIVKKEYKIRKQELDEEIFVERCDYFRFLEEKFKEYSIVIPNKISNIEEEGDALNHCVRLYIPKVIKGDSLICFLRENENLDKPLVTIEVKDGFITQAYGVDDSKPSEEQLDVLRKWAKKNSLVLSWAWD